MMKLEPSWLDGAGVSPEGAGDVLKQPLSASAAAITAANRLTSLRISHTLRASTPGAGRVLQVARGLIGMDLLRGTVLVVSAESHRPVM